jgi:hypothetical protein
MNLSNNFLEDTLAMPFKDDNGVTKLLIGAALIFASSIIPIVPLLFFLGYLYRIHHRVVTEKNGPVMPEWDDWSRLLTDGLKYLGALLIYMLPVIILMVGGYAVMIGSTVGMAIVSESAGSDAEAAIAFLMMLVMLASFALIMVGVLLSVVVGVLSPAGLVHMSVQDDFAAAFRVNEWSKILRANLSGFLLAFLILLGLGIISTMAAQFLYITVILCCLMPFVMSFVSYYLGVVSANLFAEAYLKGQAKLAQPASQPMLEDVPVA